MTLKEWMKANKVTQVELAARIGVSSGMVWQAMNGKKGFGKANILKIVKETGGAVTVEELMKGAA